MINSSGFIHFFLIFLPGETVTLLYTNRELSCNRVHVNCQSGSLVTTTLLARSENFNGDGAVLLSSCSCAGYLNKYRHVMYLLQCWKFFMTTISFWNCLWSSHCFTVTFHLFILARTGKRDFLMSLSFIFRGFVCFLIDDVFPNLCDRLVISVNACCRPFRVLNQQLKSW